MKTKEQPKFWLLGMFLFASLGFFLLANNAYAEDTDLSTINDEFRFDYGVHYYRFEETGTARNDENFAGEGADIKMTPIPGGYHWVVTFNKGAKDLADGGESPNNSDPKKNFRYNNPRYAIGIPKGLQRPTSMTFTVYDDKGQLVHEPETVQNTQTRSGYVDGLEKTYIDDHNWLDDQRFIDRQSYTSEPFDEYADWFFRGKGDQSIDTLSAGLDRPLKDEKGIEVDKSISRDLDVIYTFRGADEGNRLGAWGYAATYVVEFDTKFKFDETTGYSDAKMELLAAMRNRESDPAMNIYIKMAKYSIYNTVWYCYNYDLEIMPVNSHFSEEDFDNSWIPQPGVSGTKDTIKWIMLLGYPYDVRNSKYLDYYILRYDRDPAYARYSYADKYQFAANSFYYATQQAIWHFTNGKEYPKNSVAREIGELAEKLANDKVPFPDTIKGLYLDNNGAINRGKLVQNFVSLRSKNLSRENAKLSIQLEKVSGEGSPIKDNPATFDLYKGAYHQSVPSDVDPVQTDIQTDGKGLTAVLNDLESDTAYTLVEKSAPTGYSVSAPLVFKMASIYKSNRYNYFWEGFNAPYGFLRPYLDYAERAGYRLEIHQKVSKDELSSNESAAGEVYEWSPAKVSVKSPESPIYKTQNEFMETDQTRMRIANFKAEAVSLGDFVWLDKNNNGIQDNGEQPVKDAKVVLYRFGQPVKVKDVQFANQGVIVSKADSTGVLKEEKLTDPESVVQTTTDKNGHYFFKNVNAGEYSVKFIAPDGSYAFTKVNTGKNDRLDSDANPQTGVSFAAGVFANTKLQDTNNPFKLNNPNIDAGFVKSVSIGDFAWIDANENGRQDNDEKPLSNVRVYLQVEKEVLINSDGATKTEYEDASYSDVVALNGSGQQAVGYSGELLSSDAFGAVYTITDENGHYAFRNILPGNYKVRFELPSSAYKYTKDKTTANVNDTLRDSDALESNIVQGKSMSRTTDIYHLDADKPVKDERDSLHLTDPSADMGVVEIGASFGDLVWFDGSYFDASAYGQERFDPTGRKVVVGDSKFDLTTEANIRKSRKNTEMTFDDRGLSYVKVQLLDEKGQPAKVKDVALNGQSIKINMDLSKAETTNKNGQKVPGGNLAQDLTDKELKADGDQLAYTYTSALELSGSTYAWTGEKNEREAFGRYFFKGLKPGKYKARFIIYRADMKLEDSGKEGAISNPFNKFIDSSATDAKLFPYSQQNRIRFVQKAPEDQIGADGEYNRASQVNTVEGAFVGETDVFDLSNVTKSYKVYQDKVSNPSFKLELTNPSIDAGIVASSTATKNITLGNRIWIDRNSDGLQNEDENDSWRELGDKGFEGTQVELYERTKDDLTRDFFKAINGDENAKNDSLEMYTYKGVTSTTKDGFYRFENLAEEKLYRVKFLVPERISKEYQFTKANVNDSSTHMNLEAAKQIIQPVLDKKATDEASKDESDADFMVKYFSMEKLHLVDGNTQEEKVNKVNELAAKFYTALVPNALSDAANDSDVAFNGLSAAYLVNSARPSEQDINDGDSYGKQTAPNFDAGLVKDSVSIGNFVWYDEGNGNQRANGQFDQGEKPADGITAILYQKDQQGKIAPAKLADVQANESGITDFSGQKIEPNEKGELVTTTDANGKYAFKGLKPNLTLLVKFIDQKEEDKNDKVIFTTHKQVNLPTQELSIVNNQIDSENYGLTDALTVSYAAESMKVDSLDEPRFDAGLVREVSLGNRVWFDKNANGRQDEGEDFSELQKAGLTIDVKAEKVKLVDEKSYSKTVTVDKTGHYSFEHLIPGEYTITFNVKGNENKVYRYTVANASNVDDKLDSDAIVTDNNSNVALVKNVVVRNVITDDQDNPNHLTNPTVDAGLVTVGDFVDHHEYYVVTENGDKIPVTEKNHDGKRQTDDLTNPNDKYTTKKDDEKDGFKFVETKDPKNEPTYDKDGKETTGEYKPGVTQEITYVYEKPLVSLGDYTFVDR
ncbi:SdrD B-like domain-containing protein, partial [uncultured Enterococcus sp.]